MIKLIIFILLINIIITFSIQLEEHNVIEFRNNIFDDTKEKIKEAISLAKDIKNKIVEVFNKLGGWSGILSKLDDLISSVISYVKDGIICMVTKTIELVNELPKYNYNQAIHSESLIGKIITIMNNYGFKTNWITRLCNLIELIVSKYSSCSPFKELAKIIDIIIGFTPVEMIADKIHDGLDSIIKTMKPKPSFIELEDYNCYDKTSFSDADHTSYALKLRDLLNKKRVIGGTSVLLDSLATASLFTLGDGVDEFYKKKVLPIGGTLRSPTFSFANTGTGWKSFINHRGVIMGLSLVIFKSIDFFYQNDIEYLHTCMVRAEWFKIVDYSHFDTIKTDLVSVKSTVSTMDTKINNILNHFNITN